jgi:Flp pilus assembly protein TadD
MKFLIFLLTFALLALMIPAESSAADPTSRVQAGAGPYGDIATDAATCHVLAQKMIARQDWTGAVLVTREAIARYPDNGEFYHLDGYALRKLGLYGDAVSEISRAIALDPKPVFYDNRGYAYLALRDYPAALADAEAGIAGNPANPVGYIVGALALSGEGRTGEALEEIDKAIALDQGNAHAWHVKGSLLAARGNCTGAREALAHAFSINPDYNLPWPGYPGIREDRDALNVICAR